MTENNSNNLPNKMALHDFQTKTIFLSLLRELKRFLNYSSDRIIDITSDIVIRDMSPSQQSPLFQRAACWLGDVASLLSQVPRSNVYYLKGDFWSVVCVGSEKMKNELIKILFSERPQEHKLGRIAL